MPEFNSENLENLLFGYLGGKFPLSKIDESLLGENFGNHVRKLVLTLKGKKAVGKDEVSLETVAKLVPNDRDVEFSKNAMKKEINFYKTVLPRLQDFQKQNKLETFSACPEYIGSRLNLNGSKEVDADAAILLQDLWESGKEILCLRFYLIYSTNV